jgi:hypothetical protein
VRIDPFKLAHWMNARKYTAAQTATLAGQSAARFGSLLSENGPDVGPEEVSAIASALQVDAIQLANSAQSDFSVVPQSAADMHATRRPIQRDGIHFYNYYTLAAPPGRVAPVVLDILCPPDRLPALNNGHLEPAITINLGPGDINGRWGVELNPETWQVLNANSGPDRWITGDSYVEPSHCPHTYSLAGEQPARIVSYTGQSNLAPLVEEVNSWSDEAFEGCLKILTDNVSSDALLDLMLARRAHTRASAAIVAGLTLEELTEALAAPLSATGLNALRSLARVLGFDYRILLPAERRHDEVGKIWATVTDSRASTRCFGAYEVASMASAPHLPDLTGAFLRVDRDEPGDDSELLDCAENHYFVIDGELTIGWSEHGEPDSATLTPDGSAWVAPFVQHQWYGHGAVLKLGSGAHLSYLDLVELTNTFAPASTIRRSRRDLAGWGYDS